MSPPSRRSTTINISSSSWKANHKLTRNGCSRNLRISNSRSTFRTASFFMQALLFMYFIAYIALVSFFWTMQTWKGKSKQTEINQSVQASKLAGHEFVDLAKSSFSDGSQNLEVVEVDCKREERAPGPVTESQWKRNLFCITQHTDYLPHSHRKRVFDLTVWRPWVNPASSLWWGTCLRIYPLQPECRRRAASYKTKQQKSFQFATNNACHFLGFSIYVHYKFSVEVARFSPQQQRWETMRDVM